MKEPMQKIFWRIEFCLYDEVWWIFAYCCVLFACILQEDVVYFLIVLVIVATMSYVLLFIVHISFCFCNFSVAISGLLC